MIRRYSHKKITWLDLESPTQEEVRGLMRDYSINPKVAEEFLSPSLKPKVDLYANFLFVILHFPALRHSHTQSINQEVDFLIGRDTIITVRYDSVDPLHEFSKIFEVNSIISKSSIEEHAGFIFLAMVKKLYQSVMHELEFIKDSLQNIEENIFKGNQKEMVIAISKVSRDIVDIRQALSLHKEVLASLATASGKFFGGSFNAHLEVIIDEFYRTQSTLESNREYLHELRNTNDSLLTTKQNESMRLFTTLAFFTFPLSLVAVVLSSPTEHNPIIGARYDFWIIVTILVFITVCMYCYFKYKKLL